MVKNHRLINYTSSDRRFSPLKQSTPERRKKNPKLYSKINSTKKRKIQNVNYPRRKNSIYAFKKLKVS